MRHAATPRYSLIKLWGTLIAIPSLSRRNASRILDPSNQSTNRSYRGTKRETHQKALAAAPPTTVGGAGRLLDCCCVAPPQVAAMPGPIDLNVTFRCRAPRHEGDVPMGSRTDQ